MEHILHALPSGAVLDVNEGRKGKSDKAPLALELFESAPAAAADDDRDSMQVQQASNTPSAVQALQSGQGTTAARCVSDLLGLPSSSQPSQSCWSASTSGAANSSSAGDAPPRATSRDMPPPPPPALPPPRRVPSRPAAQGSMPHTPIAPPLSQPTAPPPLPSTASSSVPSLAAEAMARTIDGASFADAPAKAALLPILRAAMPPPVRTTVEMRQEHPPSSASESSTATPAATSTVVHDADLDSGETSACAALLLSAAAWARSGSAYAGEALATADAAGDARAAAFIDEDDLAAERSERLGLDAAGSDRVAPFLTKLYDLVSHPGTDDIVRWTEDGSAFRIVDAQRLSTEVHVAVLSHTLLLFYFRPGPV